MQSIKWYLNRLSLMSPGELAWRTRLGLQKRLEPLLPLPGNPQPNGTKQRLPAWPAPAAASKTPQAYLDAANRVLQGDVNLFGDWVSLTQFSDPWNVDPLSGISAPMERASNIDYRDEALVGSARNVWEVNRHFQLVTLAQAGALSGDARYHEGARQMLASWLQACPYPMGINWTSALEAGIRLINWYVADRLLGLHQNRDALYTAWLASGYRHCKFIWAHQSRHSSANNHLIGEMVGLYIAACGWPHWRESARWRADAKRIIEREAQAQVHEDGVTREQTVSYQMFVLQFLIIAGVAGESAGDPFPPAYWAKIRQMIAFLRSVADVGGHLPDFGDADEGMAFVLSPEGRARRLQDLLDVEDAFSTPATQPELPAESLAGWVKSGFPQPAGWPREPAPIVRQFPAGGYYVLGEHFGEPREVSLVFDAAPLGFLSIAAHGHADCLSFTLSLGGEPVLIDPGTFCYHTDLDWRNYFRGTSAHNTVRIDGADQSEIGGPFMWLRKAVPTVHAVQVQGEAQHIRASHDGYGKLPDPVTHTRELAFHSGSSELQVRDTITCSARHQVETFWQFAEHCDVRQVDSTTLSIIGRQSTLTLRFQTGCSVELRRGSAAPISGWVSHRFGLKTPTTTAVVTRTVDATTTSTTSIQWSWR